MKKAKYFYEQAAMNGSVHSRYNLGLLERRDGNYHRALKHYIIGAKAGYKRSLDKVKAGYMSGHEQKMNMQTLYVPINSDKMRSKAMTGPKLMYCIRCCCCENSHEKTVLGSTIAIAIAFI